MSYQNSNGQSYLSNPQYGLQSQHISKFPAPNNTLTSLPITTNVTSQTTLGMIDTPNRALQSLRIPNRIHTLNPMNNMYLPAPNTNMNTNNSFEINSQDQFNGRNPTQSENYGQQGQFNSPTDGRNPLQLNTNNQLMTHRHEPDRTPNRSSNNFLSVPAKSPLKRGKSPLQVFVMGDDNGKDLRASVTKPIDKEERLQRIIIMREAEINELRREVERLKQGTSNYFGGSMLRSDNPADNYNKQKDELQALQFENRKLREALERQESDFRKQLFEIKLKYEENARINIEMMQKEMVFQYANNDNEAIKVLKERIQQLENRY